MSKKESKKKVNEEDQQKIDRSLLKLLSIGALLGNLDSDAQINDPLPIEWVIQDICGDMSKILFKYGLTMGVC